MQVQGFRASAVQAGIRYPNRLDLGLIYSTAPATAAGVFTTNKVKAAPLRLSMQRLAAQPMAQALLVNSGNANACTGAAGMELARASSGQVATALGIDENLVQVASTGVIGQTPSLDPFSRAIPALVRELSPTGLGSVARAIMTTDLVEKTAQAALRLNGIEINLAAMAKGSGMIMPNMATMLCFVLTDACISAPVLHGLLRKTVEQSFNRISVDGDTSTNDMVLVMANGLAANPCIDDEQSPAAQTFGAALSEICQQLALKIVADGEGATKQVAIRVQGAASEEEAHNAAQTIANSPLVKTAFFGEDANWGRIMAALGRSQCRFQEDRVSIHFNDVQLVAEGLGLGGDAEARATEVLRQARFRLCIDLHQGAAAAEVHTCDFSVDYIKINANYRS